MGRRRDRIKPVSGDLLSANLGVGDEWIADAPGQIDHFFHLAALYDMTAPDELNERVNVQGTHNAVELAGGARRAGACTTSRRSPCRATTDGTFREDMFDEGQNAAVAVSPHEVRERADRPRRRRSCRGACTGPSIVVGHSQTGEIDKIDGPYYFFKALQRAAPLCCPSGCRCSAPSSADTNIVPVDYVAAATRPHRPPPARRRAGVPPDGAEVAALERPS